MKIASSIFFGLLSLAVTYRLFFKDRYDFWEALKHLLTPDIISAFKGELYDDWWNELKFLYWFGLGGLAAWLGYALVD